jgi:hypothetical protein
MYGHLKKYECARPAAYNWLQLANVSLPMMQQKIAAGFAPQAGRNHLGI